MKENDHCYYVASRYLGQIDLSIEALRKVDNDELLSIPLFYEPLFNLIMVGIVSKLEEFLKDRLELEVYTSNYALYKYAIAYTEYNEKLVHRCKKWKKAIDAHNTNEIKELVENSLDKHIYHNVDMITFYLSRISSIDLNEVADYDKVKNLIKLRHRIIHPTKDELCIPIYSVREACSCSFQFIKNVESKFILSGRQPICDDPW
jgi:hypothetical protein